ncbi:MAG: hypothetical protein IPP17_16010 [Bacteroidetes bacterium]|nr:hypothetical protein [Bacteroidota bacterium]
MKTPFAWTRKMRLLPFGSSGFGRLLLMMVLLWVGHSKVKGQDQHYLDSLKQAVTQLPADTNTVLGLKKIANYLRYEDAEQAILYAKRALELSIRLDYKRGIASSYQWSGNVICSKASWTAPWNASNSVVLKLRMRVCASRCFRLCSMPASFTRYRATI